MNTKNVVGFFLILFMSSFQLFSQQSRLISGTILDGSDSTQLAYASVNLQQQLSGTMTDGKGNFVIELDSTNQEDSLIIQFLGYETEKVRVDNRTERLVVYLKVHAVQLDEVNVYPKSAAEYLRLAYSKELENSPENAYNTYGYFRQEFEENNSFIDKKELFIKTFFPKGEDSLISEVANDGEKNSSQAQLMLYRKTRLDNEIQLGKKKYEKKKRKAERKGNEIENPSQAIISIIDSAFGGPRTIIQIARGNARGNEEETGNVKFEERSLDAIMEDLLDDYILKFSDKTTEKVMVIKATSKKKFKGHPEESRLYYIDIATDGFVAREIETFQGLPLLIKPVLFVMGIGVESIHLSWKQQNIQIKEKWYPNNIILTFEIKASKKYLFKENEHSVFKFKQVLANNKIVLNGVAKIPEKFQFDPSINYEDQVHNTENLKWELVNTIP